MALPNHARSLLLFLGVCVAGCGGGGQGPAATSASSTLRLGQVSLTYLGRTNPLVAVSSTGAISVAGVAGANVVEAVVQPAPNLSNTMLLYQAFPSPDIWVVPHTGAPYIAFTGPLGQMNPRFTRDGRIGFTFYDTKTKFDQVGACNMDGSGFVQLTSTAVAHMDPCWAPDNSAVAFDDGKNLWTHTFATGVEKKILGNAVQPAWSPDGTKIAYAGTADHQIYYMPVAGGASTLVNSPSVVNCSAPVWTSSSSGSTIFFNTTSNGVVLTDATTLSSAYLGITGAKLISASPDGRDVMALQTASNYAQTLFLASDGGESILPITSNPPPALLYAGDWSPFMPARKFIGALGVLYESGSGFIWTQDADSFAAFVGFVAKTPSTATVTLMAQSGQGSFIYDVHADSVMDLAYCNGYFAYPVGLTPMTPDILVGISGTNGQVTTVAPFIATPTGERLSAKAGLLQFNGRFTGVWDSRGHNIAPGGAATLTLDSKTGTASVQ